VEEIFHELSKLIRKNTAGWDQNGLGIVVQRYFEQRFPASKNNLKLCESTILNFLFSVDSYKADSAHCLLFGQLMADLYTPAVPLFIGDIRSTIEEECGYKILDQMERKNGIEMVKIPYAKIKGILSRIVNARGGMDTGVEAFSIQLRERFPTVDSTLIIAPE